MIIDPVDVAPASHDEGRICICICVADHNPNPMELHRHHILPLAWGGGREEANEVWLCPTSHVNVHELLRATVKYEGDPPWTIRRSFSPYIRALAREGWDRHQELS